MFATPVWGPAVDQATVAPQCPNCGRPMHLDRVVLRTGGLSDLTFKCGECWVTELETSCTKRGAGGGD
jgi:uncharacterized Zn finger protein